MSLEEIAKDQGLILKEHLGSRMGLTWFCPKNLAMVVREGAVPNFKHRCLRAR